MFAAEDLSPVHWLMVRMAKQELPACTFVQAKHCTNVQVKNWTNG